MNVYVSIKCDGITYLLGRLVVDIGFRKPLLNVVVLLSLLLRVGGLLRRAVMLCIGLLGGTGLVQPG